MILRNVTHSTIMFTHIVHISDIHIRTGDKEKCRYDEYMFVFRGLVDQINVWLAEEKRLIVVLTGDIFHHKSKIESVGIFLFQEMVSMLEKLVPVVIIRGNHDYCQENIESDAIDMIQALLHNRHAPNVRYLDQSGTYKIGNILFGVVAIQDVLQKGSATASMQVCELPTFPIPPTGRHDISVALYHGTLNGCTLQNYTRSPSGVPVEWFDGYDVVMLGDVHLRQTSKNWGYAGSLIQQNFGEPPLEHGGLLWDVKTKKAEPFNIKSCVSYVPMRSLEQIQSILRDPCCADLVKMRLASTIDAQEEADMMMIAETHGKRIHVQVHGTARQNRALSEPTSSARFSSVSARYDDRDAFDEFVESTVDDGDVADNLRRWKDDPFDLCIPISEGLLPAPLDQAARQRNKKISDLGCEYNDALSSYLTRQDPNIIFESLEWDWIMCYESGCRFDFKTTKGNLVAINARNGHGKSSFIDIVCIALFGTSIQHLRHYASSIICLQTPSKASPKTTICFKLTNQDTLYELTRTFSKMKNNAKRLTSKAVLKGNGELLHSGKTAVDQWIAEKVGGLDEFVFANILTQQGTESFFNMENNQQIDLLDRSANTNAQNQLHSIFKASVLAHAHILDGIEILRKNESAIANNLESSRSNDESIITEYEALRDRALRMESKDFVVPNKSSNELKRELDAILDIDICDSYDKVQSLLDSIPDVDKEIESDLSDLTNYANRLKHVETEIERAQPVATEINYEHELSMLAREIKNKNIEICAHDEEGDADAPDISQATLDEMQTALSKTMSCIPPEFHDGEFDLSEPHNPDCWACNARRDTNSFQAMIPLMKHCNVTHKMLRRHQERLDRQSDRDLVKRYTMLKETETYFGWLANKEVLQSRIRFICRRLLERHERIEKLRYWICVKSMKEKECNYKNACGNIQNLKSAKERRDQLVELASSSKLRIESIECAQAALVGYRIWLYQNRIIPNLIETVNGLIRMITTQDHPLELDASVQCDGNKLTVDWYINNGPQRPPIEKASGFQKFIAGLAIRIALTQQLGNVTRSSHLFLDEGFVACDKAHLRRVPVFLSDLLDLYDSILVFTHLEDLKDAMDMQIYIQRNAETQLSFFSF